MDRITYVSAGGDLFTINADGSDPHRLTGAAQVRPERAAPSLDQGLAFHNSYSWPTWSPNGARLAASRVQVTGRQDLEVTIQVFDVVTGQSHMVYHNDFPSLIAEGSPHYLYWSPDSKSLFPGFNSPGAYSLCPRYRLQQRAGGCGDWRSPLL